MSKLTGAQAFARDLREASANLGKDLYETLPVTTVGDKIARVQASATLNVTSALSGVMLLLEDISDAIRSTTQADYVLTPGAQMEGAPDPAAPGFEDLVTDTARALWKADPGNRTAARTFDEDYAASQDRYVEMARRFLDPTEDGTR